MTASAADRAFPRHAGDVLTLLRILGTPVFVGMIWCARQDPIVGWLAVVLFAGIAASDFLDGRLARQAGRTTSAGRVLDHGADIFFVLAALTGYVALELTPWWVPAAIAISFGTYVYDSLRNWAHAAEDVKPSRIGHAGGVLNYALIGVVVCNESAGLRVLPGEVMAVLYGLVPVYSGAAIAQRLRSSRVAMRSGHPKGLRP
jgi:phosphatidylglycerophosphate synthase